MLAPLSLGRIQFRDPSTDEPVRNGAVTVLDPVTSQPANTWADQAGSILNNNPVPLNNNGEAFFYGDQTYSFIVYDCCGRLIQTYSPVGFNPIALKSNGTIISQLGETIPLRYGDGITENCNVLTISESDVDFVIEIDDVTDQQFPEGSEITIFRGNGLVGAGSGFAVTETGLQKLGYVDGYTPSCGIIDPSGQRVILWKQNGGVWILFGDLD